jgi:hypothetical protein
MAFIIIGLQVMRDAATRITTEDLNSHGSQNFVDKTAQESFETGFEEALRPHSPSTVPITPQKRNFSDASATSFRLESTEPTQTKMVKPESSIPDLRSTSVCDIFEATYNSDFIQV